MRQVHLLRNQTITVSSPMYTGLTSGRGWESIDRGTQPWSAPGTFSNLVIIAPAAGAVSSGATHTFTVMKNGVATGLAVTLFEDATTGRNTADTVAVSPGDTLSLRRTHSSAAASSAQAQWAIEFESDDDVTSGHGYSWGATLHSNATARYNSPFFSNVAPQTSLEENVIAVEGAITRLDMLLDGAPGTGASYTAMLVLNGVEQDGSGGTVDTRVTISGAVNTTGFATFTLPVTPGDLVSLKTTPANTPANRYVACSIAFAADADGEYHISGHTTDAYNPGVTEYTYVPATSDDSSWNATESGREVTVGVSSIFVAGMVVALPLGPPGSGHNVTYTLRKNLADAGGPVVTIADLLQSGSHGGTVTYADGDTLTLKNLSTASATARGATWSLRIMEPVAVIQRVTQLVVEVATNEDDEDDPPAALADCEGGGTVSAGSNPAAGVALTTTTAPLVWMEVTLPGSPQTVYRWAKAGISYDNPIEARVLEFGEITRPLSDPDGYPEAASVTSVLADLDGTIRDLWLNGTLRHAAVDYFIADLETLRASGAPSRRFRGFIRECLPDGDRTFRIVCEDALSTRLNSMDAEDLQVPRERITDDIGDLTTADPMFDKPAPGIYGHLAHAAGAWQCEYVGTAVEPTHPELGSLYWFLVSIGVVTVQEVFIGALGALPSQRIQLADSAFGSYLFVPGKTGWLEANDWSVRGGRRWTLIAGKPSSPAVRLAKEGRIPIVVNVCGYETVGDRTGDTINGPARALLHFLNNHVVQDATGNWLPIASSDGDFSLFDTTTFEAVQTVLDGLFSPAPEVAGAFGGDFRQASWRARVAEFCRSFGYDFGINRHGQGILSILDRADDGSGATAFTPAQILERSVQIDTKAGAVENEVRYVYARNYVTTLPELAPPPNSRLPLDPYSGEWASGLQTIQDATSIAALGGGVTGLRRSEVQEYPYVRDQATADYVAQQRLDLLSPANGRAEVEFSLSLKHGASLELGNLVTVEHWDLPWTGARRCQVRRLQENLDDLIVRIGCRDVDDLLA